MFTPPFAGFPPEALQFLRDLKANMDRAWFQANRQVYEDAVRAPLGALVVALAERCQASRLPLRGDPVRSLFRINRDVRFSADKSPYKTHAGATLTRGTERLSQGLLYIHIEPEGSFVAAGFWHPSPEALGRMRQALVDDPKAWTRLQAKLAKGNLGLDDSEALTRLPRGFDTAPATLHPTLKLKNWVLRQPVPAPAIAAPEMVDALHDFAQRARPLLEFGWAALE